MRVYKETYKDRKTGLKCKTKRWYLDFVDNLGVRRRMPCFTGKRQTQTLGDNIEALMSCKISGQRPDVELQKWIEGLPTALLEKLAKWQLLDGQRIDASKPLAEHLNNWKNSLVASGCTNSHIKALYPRAEKVIKECKFYAIFDIDPVKVERYLVKLRDKGETRELKQIDKSTKGPKTKQVKISKTTFNYYVRALRQFGKWLVDAGRIDKNPFHSLKKVTVTDADQVRVARTLTIGEIRKLISSTRKASDYRGISGYERSLIYLLANETGLRANEIRNLKVSDFDFDNAKLTLPANFAKNRKKAVLPLKQGTAIAIKQHNKNKLPHTTALSVPRQPHLMIKADIERAGIEYKTEEGTAHFHAQRHNFATALDISAKTAKTAQSLMRHSDPRLTMNIYTHGIAEQERAAIEALPELVGFDEEAQQATGTDDVPVDCFAICSAKSGAINQNQPQSTGKIQKTETPLVNSQTAFSTKKSTSPVRLERTTFGFGGQHSIQLSYGDKR